MLCNSYQSKIQRITFKYLLLIAEKNCLFLVITVPPVSHEKTKNFLIPLVFSTKHIFLEKNMPEILKS